MLSSMSKATHVQLYVPWLCLGQEHCWIFQRPWSSVGFQAKVTTKKITEVAVFWLRPNACKTHGMKLQR